jgi:SAM-dependent methyltransferase
VRNCPSAGAKAFSARSAWHSPARGEARLLPVGRGFSRRLAALYAKDLRGTVLDVGCGTGGFGRLCPCSTYTELTTIPQALKVASQYEKTTLDDLNSGQLPYADESFAAVLCECLLKQLAEPWLLVSEIQRVLRDGGTVDLNCARSTGNESRRITHTFAASLQKRSASRSKMPASTLAELLRWERAAVRAPAFRASAAVPPARATVLGVLGLELGAGRDEDLMTPSVVELSSASLGSPQRGARIVD